MNPRHLRHTRCQKLFLFPQAVAQQKKKAELFYKERLWVYNYVMQKTKIIQKDYSLSSMNYQLKLPFELEVLIPFIKDMEEHLSFHYRDIVADAGYESEENYLFLEGNGQTAYIKPNIFKSRISERIRGRAVLQRSCFLLCSSAIRRRHLSKSEFSPTR